MGKFFKAIMVIAAFVACVCACALDSEQYFDQIFRVFVLSSFIAVGIGLVFYGYREE